MAASRGAAPRSRPACREKRATRTAAGPGSQARPRVGQGHPEHGPDRPLPPTSRPEARPALRRGEPAAPERRFASRPGRKRGRARRFSARYQTQHGAPSRPSPKRGGWRGRKRRPPQGWRKRVFPGNWAFEPRAQVRAAPCRLAPLARRETSLPPSRPAAYRAPRGGRSVPVRARPPLYRAARARRVESPPPPPAPPPLGLSGKVSAEETRRAGPVAGGWLGRACLPHGVGSAGGRGMRGLELPSAAPLTSALPSQASRNGA